MKVRLTLLSCVLFASLLDPALPGLNTIHIVHIGGSWSDYCTAIWWNSSPSTLDEQNTSECCVMQENVGKYLPGFQLLWKPGGIGEIFSFWSANLFIHRRSFPLSSLSVFTSHRRPMWVKPYSWPLSIDTQPLLQHPSHLLPSLQSLLAVAGVGVLSELAQKISD